eukprot:gene17086-biopygen3360
MFQGLAPPPRPAPAPTSRLDCSPPPPRLAFPPHGLAATVPLAAHPGRPGGTQRHGGTAWRHGGKASRLTCCQKSISIKITAVQSVTWWHGGTVAARNGGAAARWRHTMAAWQHSGGTEWRTTWRQLCQRHGGGTVAAQSGGTAAQLAARVPLAAQTDGTAARRHNGGNENLATAAQLLEGAELIGADLAALRAGGVHERACGALLPVTGAWNPSQESEGNSEDMLGKERKLATRILCGIGAATNADAAMHPATLTCEDYSKARRKPDAQMPRASGLPSQAPGGGDAPLLAEAAPRPPCLPALQRLASSGEKVKRVKGSMGWVRLEPDEANPRRPAAGE